MILLDVNVLVAAYRGDHPHHEMVRPWFDTLLAGTGRFTVPDTVWASFVRITTHRRVFRVPSTAAEAFSFLRAVRAHPHSVPTVPGDGHLSIFETLCTEDDARGDLAADAYVAALAMEQGAVVATFDRDFARFGRLETTRPVADA